MAGKTYPDADVTGRNVDSELDSLAFVELAVWDGCREAMTMSDDRTAVKTPRVQPI